MKDGTLTSGNPDGLQESLGDVYDDVYDAFHNNEKLYGQINIIFDKSVEDASKDVLGDYLGAVAGLVYGAADEAGGFKNITLSSINSIKAVKGVLGGIVLEIALKTGENIIEAISILSRAGDKMIRNKPLNWEVVRSKGKIRYLAKKAIQGEVFYLIFMLFCKILFSRNFDYYDTIAGIIFGLIFGNMKWKDNEKKYSLRK